MEGKLFGDKLRYLLAAKSISAKELSFRSKISQSHLSKIINNQIQPRYDKIINIADALMISPGIFFENDHFSESFGKPLNLNAAVIETDFMLADIFLNEDKNVFGFFIKYLKDYESMLNKYAGVIKSEYEFIAYINEGEMTLKTPGKKKRSICPGGLIKKENNFEETAYSVKAGTCITAIIMGANMHLLWNHFTKNNSFVLSERVIK